MPCVDRELALKYSCMLDELFGFHTHSWSPFIGNFDHQNLVQTCERRLRVGLTFQIGVYARRLADRPASVPLQPTAWRVNCSKRCITGLPVA